mgnify:CR=1 FL=1
MLLVVRHRHSIRSTEIVVGLVDLRVRRIRFQAGSGICRLRRTHPEIAVGDLYDHPSLGALAAHLDDGIRPPKSTLITPQLVVRTTTSALARLA